METGIYNEDCLKGMKRISDSSIDLVLTDPPYNVGKDYGKYKDSMDEKTYWNWYKKVFREVYRVLGNGYLYVSCTSRQLFKIRDLLENIGFQYIQYLIWYRPNMVGGTTMIKLPWSLMHEPILLFKKGKRIPMLNEVRGFLTHDVLTHVAPQTNYNFDKRYHITQKPFSLYLQIVARTPGKILLDPFAGSGTALLAGKCRGRDYIGFEIDPDYYQICIMRLEQEILKKRRGKFNI